MKRDQILTLVTKVLSDTDFLKVVQGPTKYNKTEYLYIKTSCKI